MPQRSNTLVDRCIAEEQPNMFTSALNDHAEYLIRMAMRDTDFNISRAAVRLGIHRNVMKRWMKRLGITVGNDPIQLLPLVTYEPSTKENKSK